MELEDWKPIRPSVLSFTVTNLLGIMEAEINNKDSSMFWKSDYEKTIRFFAIVNRWKKFTKKSNMKRLQ